ncbi:DJ-1/PfpI family protein [Deinococcus apachensis]|uniref:DJ-1/PfpI family protein n=1 Tax=Deinococcus apachensis TaxID=309886 RepID=UPI000378752A|nr:DJ-1/PfpI family protein [Deinococcus apachensis]
MNVAIFVFDEVEVLDFAGPFEVFCTASRVARRSSPAGVPFEVLTVGQGGGAVRARGGLTVTPTCAFGAHPPVDVLIVPGGVVDAERPKAAVRAWLAAVAGSAALTASVCTGAFLLGDLGLFDGRAATTHWEDLDDFAREFPGIDVRRDVPWVDLGSVVSSAGISAGIDMSLHLVRRLHSPELARRTARQMQYTWHEGERG